MISKNESYVTIHIFLRWKIKDLTAYNIKTHEKCVNIFIVFIGKIHPEKLAAMKSIQTD